MKLRPAVAFVNLPRIPFIVTGNAFRKEDGLSNIQLPAYIIRHNPAIKKKNVAPINPLVPLDKSLIFST